MADKVEIEVRIGPDGKVVIETRGLKGSSCLAETAALEKAVGRVVRREKTREAWEQVTSARGTVKAK